MITFRMFFFIPEVKNGTISRLLNACFAILNIATNFWLIQNCGVICKTNMTFIRTCPHNTSSNNTNMCCVQTVKFPPCIGRKWLC